MGNVGIEFRLCDLFGEPIAGERGRFINGHTICVNNGDSNLHGQQSALIQINQDLSRAIWRHILNILKNVGTDLSDVSCNQSDAGPHLT